MLDVINAGARGLAKEIVSGPGHKAGVLKANSDNAVLGRVDAATIIDPLLAYLKFRSRIGWCFQVMSQLLQLNVFKLAGLVDLFSPSGKTSKVREKYPLLAMAS